MANKQHLRGKLMAGTRTAPTVGALTPTKSGATLSLIDASGDLYSAALYVAGDGFLDLAEVESVTAAYQAATNASVWKVTQVIEWEGEADPNNAPALFRASVTNGINLLIKDVAADRSETPRVVAPIDTIMQGNQDIPLLVSPLTTLVAAYLTVLGGAYALDSMQFTGRRERTNNPRVRT